VFRCGSKGREEISRLRHFSDASVTAVPPVTPSAIKAIATLPFVHSLPQVDDRHYLNEKMGVFMIGPGCSTKHTDVMSVFSAVSGSLSFFAMHQVPRLVKEVLSKLCPHLKSLDPLLVQPQKLTILRQMDFRHARRQLATSLTTFVSSEDDLRRYVQHHRLGEMINCILERVQSLSPPVYEDLINAQRRHALLVVEASGAISKGAGAEPAAAAAKGKKKGDDGGPAGSAPKEGGTSGAAAAAALPAPVVVGPPPEMPSTDSWSVVAQVLREHFP
jgi:hypothetical protein